MILSRLFSRPTKQTALPAIPEGRRVYAIGDVHGCLSLFDRLLARIDADNEARHPADVTLILLGDLVDRGPDSAGVVERAIQLQDRGGDFRWLLGNHEEVFLKALSGDPAAMRYFVRIGGGPTIHSYGLDGDEYRGMAFDELAEAFPRLVPERHRRFLQSAEEKIAIGDYLFVHAGIRPGVGIEQQRSSDLRWIRDDFLDDGSDHGCVVVHGHTIFDEVQVRPNRIGIDTGAYATGRLTAVGLQGTERWFITAEE
jgi:serine/threonine protein phosphatase 1